MPPANQITSIMPDSMLQAKRIQSLYKQVNFILLSNILAALLLSIVIFDLTQNIYTMHWFSFLALFTALRYLLLKEYYKHKRDDNNTIKWGKIFTFTTFISGCTWGAASILFLQTDDVAILLLLLMTITGLSVGSAAALANYAISYYTFVTPTILPFVYMLILENTIEFNVFSMMLLLFLVLQIIIARKNQATLDKSIILNYQNQDLVNQLNTKKEIAEAANSSKTKFLAAASHDLRQPLHSMRLFIDILDNSNTNKDQNAIITKIKKSCSSLENLLESLLDISKLDAQIVSVTSKPFPIQSLFDLLKNEFESIAREKKLDIRFIQTRLWINSDHQIIERILRNLVSNAIRYTDNGKVLVGCRKNGDIITIFVYDTGTGISIDNINIIFEEFKQLHNPNRNRSEGLGLGLSIVKRLTELLNTELLLQSNPGRGSVFSIKLPLALPYNTTSDINTPLFFDDKLTERRIIIIEDEAEIREALNILLTKWGCDVYPLNSISEITQRNLPTNKPDIILADYRLGNNETGIMIIHAICDYYQDDAIPAIIITGDTAPDILDEINKNNFNVLHKPVSGGKLRATLNSFIPK